MGPEFFKRRVMRITFCLSENSYISLEKIKEALSLGITTVSRSIDLFMPAWH
jgi:MoaA/NifB/PqqE/SkfB family radical SAM enzyme